MTGIQVQYWANVETARSHRANEYLEFMNILENKRHNMKVEDINEFNAQTSRMSLLESARHNQQDEAIRWGTLEESVRTHKENESISWFNALETQRAHQAGEAINWFNAQETQRAHMEGERISWANLELTERDVTTRENAQLTREAELAEKTRHDERQDAISAYGNTIKKLEYDLNYSKWYDPGGLKDTEMAKQVSEAAHAKNLNQQTQDLIDKRTGEGMYWDAQEWLGYMKLITGYASLGLSAYGG